ncbi:MAG: glycosyltransferase family 4 protein [bacterium]
MQSKNILMVGPYAQGGISSVINSFLESDLKDKVLFEASYVEAPTLQNWIRFIFFYIKYNYILLTNNNIKIVHIFSAEKGSLLRKAFILLAAKLYRKKTIINFHSCNPTLFYKDDAPIIKQFIKIILDNVDLILVLSNQWKEIIANKTSNKNIEVLYNPIVIKTPVDSYNEVVNILFMGRIGQRKGAYDIIEAAKLLRDQNIKITMCGDGEVSQIREIVSQNSLENIINVSGWIKGKDVEDAYKNADIFILPSYNEGLPMSILEAMSYGLPIISTNIAGIPEQVIENENGFLITPGDVKTLAEKISVLSSDKQLREKMGARSYSIAKEKFDINVIVAQLNEIYSKALG